MRLADLKGLGTVRMEALRAAGIISLRDLLYYMPINYKDILNPGSIMGLNLNENVAIRGVFRAKPRLNRFKGTTSVTGDFSDESGVIRCVWYNQPWMAKRFSINEQIILFGRMTIYDGQKLFVNPSVETQQAILPIYRSLPSLPSKTIASLNEQALKYCEDTITEGLPESLRNRYNLIGINDAVRESHFPSSLDALALARRRMAFEKLLLYRVGIGLLHHKEQEGVKILTPSDFAAQFWQSLPFEPTKAQKRVLDAILVDMAGSVPMSRLVQGDVGCGKTAVALGALFGCAKAGFQGAMMAPTEILAAQHYQYFKAYFEPLGIRVGYLHGGMRVPARRDALEKVATGEWQIVVGTHALISKDVHYANLGLVVTDEQHRFGVSQRTMLIKKSEKAPNVLVMSATPIPRTLALILYGDLDISVIDELPKNRIPVQTRIVPEMKRMAMYDFIREEVKSGRQAYIVCPLVEESESTDELKAAQSHYRELKAGPLQSLRVGLTYGNQPQQEKNEVMDVFQKGEMDVLVCTTVIEVGVNVPNATVMVIEDANRFGLSQLHQLRGRVGRGSEQSWCFLLSEPNDRLKAIVSTNDGFVIAQKDLEMRGYGELIGTRQHGHDIDAGFIAQCDAILIEEVTNCLNELKSNSQLQTERAIIEVHASQYMKGKFDHISFN